ncbi:MAG: hypothetical protein ACO3UW_11930 [Candidatus Nanopelagicales bacterium]
MTTPTRIPANVRKVLTAIRAREGWRGSDASVGYIMRHELAVFVEAPLADKGWRLTEAGEAALRA